MLSKSAYSKLSPSDKAKVKSMVSSKRGPKKKSGSKRSGTGYSKTTSGSKPWHYGLASDAGGAIGSYFGPVGAALGRSAGDLFRRATGFGDYKVGSNSLIGMGSDPPTIKNSGSRNTIIRHREFLTDIVGTTSFTNTVFPINAGLVSTFPWGAQIGQNFEQYNIKGLIFEFKTTCATALSSSTNTAMGTVIMATEYNSINAPFSSKSQMENHEFCTSSVPSISFMHPIECSREETSIKTLYVRSGAVPSNADQRMYDLGNFQIATVGMQASNIIGELWCTFEIELLKPVLYESAGDSILFDHYKLASSQMSSANMYGLSNAGIPVGPNGSGSNAGTFVILNNAVSSSIIFPNTMDGLPAQYFVCYQATGSTTTLTLDFATPNVSPGVTVLPYWQNDSGARITQPGGAVSSIQFVWFIINIAPDTSTATVTYNINTVTLPGSITSGDLFITQMSPYSLSKVLKVESKESKSEEKFDDEDEDFTDFLAWKRLQRGREEKKLTISTFEPPTPPTPQKQASRK